MSTHFFENQDAAHRNTKRLVFLFCLAVLAIVAGSGVILAAIYMLWAYERMFTGPVPNPKYDGLRDLGFREIAIIVPLIVIVLAIGIYPKPVLERIEPSAELILERIEATTDFDVPEFGRSADIGSEASD